MGRHKKNEFIIKGDTTVILCKRKGITYEMLIDTEDLDKVTDDKYGIWYATPKGSKSENAKMYPECKIRGTNKSEQMYRVIMGVSSGVLVDHINGDSQNNKKCNLRVADKLINSRNVTNKLRANNRSGQRGVYWDSERQKWGVQIRDKGKVHSIGRFKLLEDAIVARKKAEDYYWGGNM